ncbi:magnesium transporter [Bacillus sp. JCM 19034]|uniref:magnesium transporter n=1 Tax=Bacillus sp. JCM 19034 TaxID=1481928 RepID=UPI000A4F5B6F
MVRLDKKSREQYAKLIVEALQQEDLNLFRESFLELHRTDQVEIFLTLDKENRQRVYSYLSPSDFAEIFGGLEFEMQAKVVSELDERYFATIFDSMFADDVATYLTRINDDQADQILTIMEPEKAKEVREILSYTPKTAGAVMTKEFISISSSDAASVVIEKLREHGPDAETIYYLYVVNEQGELVGVLSLRDLITVPAETRVEEMMSTRVVSVPVDMDQEEVAKIIQKYDFLAAPVVSTEGSLLGIVTVDDVMDIVEEEATEDLGGISAAKGATDVHLSAFTAAKKRSPWIILLMFFGLITAEVIGQFEETLESIVLLAAFIPLIMDSAGNTGTQSLAVAVRGLALGTVKKGTIARMIRREFGTGLMLGSFVWLY